ncbi:MAG: DUF1501 domain-containing protein, partial [Planctomycetaceae bacterium]|nr:DUF1501 domain-containing protein [Planctomycetaceae bacterium]
MQNVTHLASPLRFSRRTVLQAGALSTLGLGLPGLMAGEQRSDGRRTGTGATGEKSCIFIVQYGGAPQHDTWDMKPEAPEEIRGAFRPIDTVVPGMQICELFPRLAQQANRYSLIRSMVTNNGGHDGAMHVGMTGYPNPTDQTPYFGSVVSKLAPSTQAVPSYVWVQNLAGDVRPWYLTGGSLGMGHSPLRVGTDLDNPSNPKFRFTAFDPPAEVTADRLSHRQNLLATVNRESTLSRVVPASPATPAHDAGATFQHLQERAHDLITGSAARRAFDLSHEQDPVRQRYGQHPLGQNLLMARRLIEAGVRLVTVVAWTGTPPGEAFRNVQTWDMHGVLYKPGDSLFGSSAYGLNWALPRVDEGVSAVLEDLADRGMLDSTTVCMVGEFGRTPKVNDRGRDHWPQCYSAMLA